MSRKKNASQAPETDGPNPDRGGAWVRLPDGTLARDPDEDQHIPADELEGEEAPVETPVAPAGGDLTNSQGATDPAAQTEGA